MYRLTMAEFFCYREGFLLSKETDFKISMIQMRKLFWATLTPHMKQQISEHELMPFDWEEQVVMEKSEAEIQEILEQIEQQKAFWAKVDAKA